MIVMCSNYNSICLDIKLRRARRIWVPEGRMSLMCVPLTLRN